MARGKQAANLISELDGTTGTVLAEYIWLDGTPLAYIELGQLYHIHTDHLATPKFATGNGFVESDLKTGAYSTITDPITMAKGRSVGGRWGAHIAAEMGSYTNW